MKFTPLKKLSALTLLVSSVAFGHSAMFDDYFEFDDSDEGEKVAMAKNLARGDAQASRATVCSGGSAEGFPCNKVDFQSFLPKESMGGGSAQLNDIWGWTDPLTGQEIAIVGRTNGTSFVDVTNASSPVFLGFLPTRNPRSGSTSWRDMKTFDDHVFIVADGSGNSNHGLQVFDLNTLRDITNPGGTLSATATLGGFGKAHNIAINEDSGFAYIVGANQCSGGLYMVDISNPSQPSFAGCFSADGYTHDAQCVIYNGPDQTYRGREICVGYNEDTITIVDVSNKSNPVQISRKGYPGSRYTHQGWFLDDNHELLIMNDELDEQRNGINTTSYIWDVSDLNNPREIGRYVGPTGAIDHNLYTRDGYVFEANYRAGLRILSTDRISNGEMEEVAFFDTIPGSNSAQFSGLWSSYVDFESRNVIVSDIGNGLFVLRPDWGAINPGATPTPTPVPGCATGAVDLRNVIEYSNNSPGDATVSADGCSITLTGNEWRITGFDFEIGADTSVSFEFSAQGNAEIQGVGFDQDTTASSDRIFQLAGSQNWGIDDFSYTGNGGTQSLTIPVGQFYTGAGFGFVIANDDDASPAGTSVTVSNVVISSGVSQTPTPTPVPTCAVEEGFENGNGGWSNSSASSCTTGAFVSGSPTEVVDEGVTTQVGGANSGSNAYFTAPNSAAGTTDVDGGNCIASSPTYSVNNDSTLSVSYFHGQRDAGDDPNGDFFNLEVSTDGGNSFQSIASAGDVTSNASWANTSAQIPSGSNVVLRVQCSDGAATGNGDLVECGIDDVSICPN